jgi:hypothetical protein
MDFNTFVIAGPSTAVASTVKITGGSVTPGAGLAASPRTQCQTDTFTITGVPGGTPPTICGINTGYHGNYVYLKRHRPMHTLQGLNI